MESICLMLFGIPEMSKPTIIGWHFGNGQTVRLETTITRYHEKITSFSLCIMLHCNIGTTPTAAASGVLLPHAARWGSLPLNRFKRPTGRFFMVGATYPLPRAK